MFLATRNIHDATSVLQRVAYNSIRGAYCINSYHAEKLVEKYDLISALMMPQPGTEPGPLTIRVSVLPITLLGTSRGHQRVAPEGDPCACLLMCDPVTHP